MATCKDCVHCDVCDMPIITDGRKNASNCKKFKNKADYKEVKHGEWIPIVIQDNYLEPPYCDTIKCSECGAIEDVSLHDAKYCHMCGAKMDGKDINVTTTRGKENGDKQ